MDFPMTFHAQMASPLGRILLCSDGAHLTGLYFVGQKDCPALQSLPQPLPKAADPTAGMMAGAPIKNIRVRQPQTELDLFGVDSATAPMQASHALGNSNETGRATDTTLGQFSLMQDATPTAATAVFKQTHDELGEYFAGERRTFTVTLRLEGTPFPQQVWEALLTIPYGEYVSYGDVALEAGLTEIGRAHVLTPVTK